ncbi:MAG: hypothetical protein QOG83_1496 [Alphaproteobacteria bacterium]|jgi:hypothetical protein|nr:hypothetical protein [Alphaproteobacteria bacterium]
MGFAALNPSYAVNGRPIDPTIISEDLVAILETGVLAYVSHAIYNSAFRR